MTSIERQFMWALQALAQQAETQPSLFPTFVAVADELAQSFDDCYRVANCESGAGWPIAAREACAALDALLAEMSGPDRLELWGGDGCLSRPEWTEVRRLARLALDAFGWPVDLPPPDRAVYVEGGS